MGPPKEAAGAVRFSRRRTRCETIAVAAAATTDRATLPSPGIGRERRGLPWITCVSQWVAGGRGDLGAPVRWHAARTSDIPDAEHTVSLSPGRSTRNRIGFADAGATGGASPVDSAVSERRSARCQRRCRANAVAKEPLPPTLLGYPLSLLAVLPPPPLPPPPPPAAGRSCAAASAIVSPAACAACLLAASRG